MKYFFSCNFFLISFYLFTQTNIEAIKNIQNYCGKDINDPFIYMENDKNDKIDNWYKSETIKTIAVFDSIKGRDRFLNELLRIDSLKTENKYKVQITENKQYFYLKENENQTTRELYYREKFDGKEIFLFSPKDYKNDLKRDYTINYIKPSWDGKKIAVSLSYQGKELSDVIIIDVKSKKILEDKIENAWPGSFFGINWLSDNSGFIYLHFPNGSTENSESILHILGKYEKTILSEKTHPNIIKDKSVFPSAEIKQFDKNYVIAYLSGVDSYWDTYYVKVEDLFKDRIIWKPLFKKEDGIYRSSGIIIDSLFYYMTSSKNKNFSIEYFDLDRPLEKKELISFEDEVIESFIPINKNEILLSTMKNGIESKLYLLSDELEEIELPKKSGTIYIDGINKKESLVYITTEGWLHDYEDYYFDLKSKKFIEKDFVPNISYDEFKDIIVNEIEIPSHDNEQIPLTIIYNKNIVKDGSNPTFITGYGAYGRSYTPYFSTLFLNFVAQGGVVAIAHVRGGGEKGDAWHKAGQKTTKPNTWKDLIACTEYLIEKKYTSSRHVGINGGSAGGIMVGRAMTERPDLFAAVVSQVGQLNPSRGEFRPGGGKSNYKEYGSIKDSIECQALIKMDPYLNIKDKGVNYPATLLTAGANDPRIPVWIPGKFAARLKASDTENPVLLFVDNEAGHFSSDKKINVYKEYANIYSFILWQTGHPDYQLKNNEQLEINN